MVSTQWRQHGLQEAPEMPLPYLTPELASIDAEFRSTPEDFKVDEIPAYPPSGSGDHVFVQIEKRGLTTRDAVRAL